MKSIALGCLLVAASVAAAEGEQQFADIGDLKLQSGAVLKNCRVGYRTFGHLDADKGNAILVPTWYLGTSGDLAGAMKPGGLVNTDKYYAIAVDSLTNGVSTSPSNSKSQRDAAFPVITIRDMVESQHAMLQHLGISHLKAVMGISMGGIQTFQWMTAYPDFMDKAIPIVGSPRPTSYDLMYYGSGVKTLKAAIADKAARTDLIRAYADYFWLALNTPTYYVKNTKREDAMPSLSNFENALLKWNPYDMEVGLEALYSHDVFGPFGEDESKAASAVRAKLFVIVASQDHCVNPKPALDFAKLLNAPSLILTDDNGHQSPGAEMPKVSAAIEQFLAQ